MPMDSSQVSALRQKLGDREAANIISQQDPTFKDRLDYVQSNIKGAINPLKEKAMYSQTLDAHFNGQRFGRPTNNVLASAISAGNNEATSPEGGAERFSVLRTLKNIPTSGARFIGDVATGLANTVNPDVEKNTVVNLGKMLLGAAGNSVETVAGVLGVENPEELLNLPGEEAASALGEFYAQRYGGAQNILNTVQEDPVGFMGDISLLFTGAGAGLGAASKLSQAGAKSVAITSGAAKAARAGSKLTKIGTNVDPALGTMRLAKGAVNKTSQLGKFAASQATGLNPQTISTIMKNEKFSLAPDGRITRPQLASKIDDAIVEMRKDLGTVGKQYEPILKSTKKVPVQQGWLDDFLTGKGFKVTKKGLEITDDTKVRLTPAELSKLDDLYKQLSKKKKLTPQQFVNLRHEISDNLAKFEGNVPSRSLQSLGNEIYNAFNDAVRDNIPGLRELDEAFAPQLDELTRWEKEWIDKSTGELRDSAINKIANATGKGKDQLLNRLMKKVPEIEDEINILKAIEDVEYGGTKVGTYTRSLLQGGGIAIGTLTGNPLIILASIASVPSVAVPMLRAYGRVARVPARTIRVIIKNMKTGKPLSPAQKQIMSEAIRFSTISEEQQND